MPTPEYKKCSDCQETKHRDQFYKVSGYPDTCRSRCKPCYNARVSERWAEQHPPQHKRPLEDYPRVDPDFGHWLAGFTDGEGSFSISRPRKSYICSFHISLRMDDIDILHEACARTGLGYVAPAVRKTLRSRNEKPQARWDVGGKIQCHRLVQIFTDYPLRAKKAGDFSVWTKAVLEWNSIGRGTGRGNSQTDWSRMARYFDQIREVRQYREPSDHQDSRQIPTAA